MNGTLLLRDVEVRRRRVDVLVDGDRIAAIGERLTAHAESEVDGYGGALLPGLHDHHIHLLATAAARASLDVAGTDRPAFVRLVAAAARRAEWLRVVGYDDQSVGDLVAGDLDVIAGTARVRVQHRSGALWVLSSAAVRDLGPLDECPGVERDGSGEPTGRFWRADAWLAHRWPELPLDLAELGADLARLGVTGVTDATPFESPDGPKTLVDAPLPQRVTLMGGIGLAGDDAPAGLSRGPVKLVLADHDLPALDDVVTQLRHARAAGRPVAVHCVTAEALVVTLAALRQVGPMAGDRIEHAAVVPAGLVPDVLATAVRVVTQPGLVYTRGDDYLGRHDRAEQADLWRCGSLLRAGVPVAAGSDAPYGPLDPWVAIRAAITRRTAGGAPLGAGERITARQALALYLGDAVRKGAPADLVLCTGALREVLGDPQAERVRATVIRGRLA